MSMVNDILDIVNSQERFRISPNQADIIQNFLNSLFFAFSEGVEDTDSTELISAYPDFNLINTLAKGRIRNAFAAGMAAFIRESQINKPFPSTSDTDTVTVAPLSIASGVLTFTDGILTAATNPT